MNSYPNMQSDMGMGPQGFMDGMMDSGMGQMDAQSDLATPSPSFGNRQGPGTPMMDMAVQPPRNMEDMNRIYARYKELQTRLGANASSSQEFVELSKILKAYSQRQHMFRQQQQQQQQQQHRMKAMGQPQQMQQGTPQGNMTPQMGTPQFPSPGQPQQPQQQRKPSSAGMYQNSNSSMQSMNGSPVPPHNQPGVVGAQGMPRQSPTPHLEPQQQNSPYTPDMLMQMKNQLMAYRQLSKGAVIPPQVLQALFRPTGQPPQMTQPQQQPPQQQQQPQMTQQQQQQPPMQQPSMGQPPMAQQMQSPAGIPQSPMFQNANRSQSPAVSSDTNSPGMGKRRTPSQTGLRRSSKQEIDGVTPIAAPAVPPPPPAAPETISGYKDPCLLLEGTFSFDDITTPAFLDKRRTFIPSIMPRGMDAEVIKDLYEEQVNKQISDRITELKEGDLDVPELDEEVDEESADSTGSDDTTALDNAIELKSLQLIDHQKAWRGDLLADTFYFNSVGLDPYNKIYFTRMKKTSLQEAFMTEQFGTQQLMERQRHEVRVRSEQLIHICKHAQDTINASRSRRLRQARVAKACQNYHVFTEREEQKRMERNAKQRLQALRANDEEAYIKLLDQTKDTRITDLLRQTNTFLDSLAQAVKDQQKSNNSNGNHVDFGPQQDMDDEDPDNQKKADYYAVAHRIQEPVSKQPDMLVGGQLKEYQIKGLQWMLSLFNNNLNGILADEMGLGKTIQTISLIAYLIETKKIPGPYLVIVPLSTLTNWTLEFEKWAPAIKKLVYKGPPMARKAQQNAIRAGDFQVLLTTYEYIIKDRPVLSRIKWVHMIIDEGHRMKNAQSKLSSTLTQYYHTRYRLILTGTPLQNSLPELWALLNFVLPKIFNSVKSFDEWFNTPFASTGGQDKMDLSEEETLLIIKRLHKVLRPFLLRRLKKDVAKDLPDKVEKVLKCKMSALQSKLYQQMIKHNVLFIGEGVQGATKTGLKGLNNQVMQLRKICNHPFVFEEVEDLVNPNRLTNDNLWRTAGKFELLDRILPKFKAAGHRILMFFQMTQIMDIMEDFMRLKGWQYLRLDGGTKSEDRSGLLGKFNAPDSPYFAFLLSTRAGGLGLNLQTADTVIIYDTDWNPHQDLQAQDRAHRIGQTKEVRILRLITEDSVEENILERAHKKLDIDGKVIQAGKFDNKSTAEEQEAFLRGLLEREEKQKEKDDDDVDDEELNEILARNDEERILFAQLDAERHATSQYGKGKIERLFTEEELPEAYKRDIKLAVEPINTDQFGRGARERKVLHYDDGLTEEQWLEAIDNDVDMDETIAKKRADNKRRQAKKSGAAAAAATASPLDELEDLDSPGVKRKRSRKQTKDPMMQVEDEQPKKKARGRGRPKDTLTPEARKALLGIMKTLYNHVLNVEDSTGRARINLFLELPSKTDYPDYYILIKQPISCAQISKRIQSSYYQSLDQFLEEFALMFANAKQYNEEGSFVYEDAVALHNALLDKASTMEGVESTRALKEEGQTQSGTQSGPSSASGQSGQSSGQSQQVSQPQIPQQVSQVAQQVPAPAPTPQVVPQAVQQPPPQAVQPVQAQPAAPSQAMHLPPMDMMNLHNGHGQQQPQQPAAPAPGMHLGDMNSPGFDSRFDLHHELGGGIQEDMHLDEFTDNYLGDFTTMGGSFGVGDDYKHE
ncbi:Catalytic subunit of the SWI/SNF chromatin remodeling complex, putative [Yarrowia lipolytica]|nr:Catalytic subunit of the SWI/SNF chromatin remodeling complex, putative [Yarrowia lipolytica]